MISTDGMAFEKGSDVRKRFRQYGSLVDELHIITFAKKSLGFKKEKISQNVFLYPTNSFSMFGYIHDALRIGRFLLDIDLITTQDPFETGIVGVALARRLNARLEVQLHTDFLSPHFKKGNLKNILRVPLGKRVLKKADCIRVVSERIKRSIKKKIQSVVVTPIVLPIFTDIEMIQNTPVSIDLHQKYPTLEHITVMVSRLEQGKTF